MEKKKELPDLLKIVADAGLDGSKITGNTRLELLAVLRHRGLERPVRLTDCFTLARGRIGGDTMWKNRALATLDLVETLIEADRGSVDHVSLEDAARILGLDPSCDFNFGSMLHWASFGTYGASVKVYTMTMARVIPGIEMVSDSSGMQLISSRLNAKAMEQFLFLTLDLQKAISDGILKNAGILDEPKAKDIAHGIADWTGCQLSAAYEVLARVAGVENWNILAARLKAQA